MSTVSMADYVADNVGAPVPTLNSRCPGCRAILLGVVEVAGERYCRECATEMLRDMAEAMKR